MVRQSITKVSKPSVCVVTVVFLVILCLEVLPATSEESVLTIGLSVKPAVEVKRLRTDLLINRNYDKLLRPVKNQSMPTSVKVFFDVQYIVSLDEKYQILSVKGILMMNWTDEHLTWNPDSYSGISMVRFSSDEIWKPDIHSIYNVKPVNIYDDKQSTPVNVYSNGSVKWFPQIVFDVPCSAQYKHYPFDSHNCTIIFAAWGHSGDDIILTKLDLFQSMPIDKQGTEWLLNKVDHEDQYQLLNDRYKLPLVNVRISLERASRIYRYICVVPTLISLISVLFGFWLLPNETSRYLVGCSNIIVLSMLLQYLAVTLPSGKVVPLLAQYSAACLCMSAAFVIVTVIANLLRECSGTPPIGFVRLAHFTLDRYLCLFSFSHTSTEEPNSEAESGQTIRMTSPDEVKRRKDWYSLSMMFDRIVFWVFVFVFVVLLSVLAAV